MLLNFHVIAVMFIPVILYFIDKSNDKDFRKLDEIGAKIDELISKYDL